MKRHPALQPLSDDHHRALVLARRLRQAPRTTDPATLAALAREVRREFDVDLDPHFRVEERWLLPALEKGDGGRFAKRIADDHARLRALVRADWSASTPHELGELLEQHVRFEERAAFPAAEALLSEGELACVRDAALASGERGKPSG